MTTATRTRSTRTSKSSKGRTAKPDTRPPTNGFRVIKWIETHCVFTNGQWIGQPFRLLLWQKLFILALFTIGPDGLRRYRWALLGVPKKNGKTELAAALALYFLIGDGELSPLVVCAAASEDQADLVFDAAKRMCELSPTLRAVTEGGRFEKEILVPSIPGAKLKRVAAVAGTNDGQNISAVICDELHEWIGDKGENVWTVLTNGVGARRQPMVLQITTAGYDLESICGEQYTYGRRIASGEIVDDRYLFHWVEAPEGADHTDPKVWEASNPSYGVTVQPAFFADQLTKKPEGVFRRYFLNQWTPAETLWLPAGAWVRCRSALELDPSLPLYVGIDVGLKNDSSAVAAAQLQTHDDAPGGYRIVTRSRIWENPYQPFTPKHGDWRFEIGQMEAYLLELFRDFPVPAAEIDGSLRPGPEFSYDPNFFTRSAQLLTGDGLAMVEYPQSDARMIPASQGLFQIIVAGQLAEPGAADLARHIANVIADEKTRGYRISKPRGSRKKIDGAVALAIATHRATLRKPQPAAKFRSNYESGGLTVSRR